MNQKINFLVSLILLPYDDLTDQVVTDPVLDVYVDNLEMLPIRKKDGYLIVTDLSNPVVRLRIESPYYHSVNMVLDLTNLDPMYPVQIVRLNPGGLYARPEWASLISGQILDVKKAPISRCPITVQHAWEGGRIQLMDDSSTTGKSRLRLETSQLENILGRQFFIQDVKNRILERFTITQQYEDSGLFILDNPLSKHYPAGTFIYQLTELATDEQGLFSFYVRRKANSSGAIRISAKHGRYKAEHVLSPPEEASFQLPDIILK